MDANRFDSLIKAFSLSAARRGMVASFLGGGLASLLATSESEARRAARRTRRDEDLGAEKRKKHKKKKHKKRKKKGNPPDQGGDEAPPCTEESCPIPPGCSEQDLEGCSNALVETLLTDIELCRLECDDPNSTLCQACLDPIVASRLAEAEACAAESCSSSARATADAAGRNRGEAQAGRAEAREWWVRHCDKAECCYADMEECLEDVLEELGVCLGGVVVTCVTAAPLCAPALFFCLSKLTYDSAKCKARHGCPEGDCVEGDICCPYGAPGCGASCCEPGTVCCNKKACCLPGYTCCGDSCCRDGEFYCCGNKRCCPLDAPVCGPGNDDEPAACCRAGDKPCHGTCCSGSPHVLCCDKFNGQTYCYADVVGCPA